MCYFEGQITMKENSNIHFFWSDAWLACAISHCPNGADLKDIYSVGDLINHAIFMDDEILSGLLRLAEAGYIVEESSKIFFVAGDAKDFWLKRNPQSTTLQMYMAFKKFLKVSDEKKLRDCANESQKTYPGITKEMLEKAYKGYKISK